MNGTAVELSEDQINKLWDEEPIYARMRRILRESEKPVDWHELRDKYINLIEDYESGRNRFLERTKYFTAFQIVPEYFDFYKAEKCSIGDRIVYRRNKDTWTKEHVCA